MIIKGKKKLLSGTLDAFGISGLMLKAGNGGRRLPILAYHRVIEETDIYGPDFPYEELNVSSFSRGFESQLDFISRHFQAITFSDLKGFINAANGGLPANPIIITFDDGYKDNYKVAFPLLNKYGLKAVFFPVTGLVGGGLMEIEKLAYAVKTSGKKELDLSAAGLGRHSLKTAADRIAAKNTLTHELRRLDEGARRSLSSAIFAGLDSEIPPGLGSRLMMDWSEIKELAAGGMEIGSHSASHPILSRIPEKRLRDEVEGSRRELEARLGTEVCAFSFPAGGKDEYMGERVKSAVRRAGYTFGISYFNGLERAGLPDPYCLRRLRVSRYVDMPLFKAGLTMPWMLV